MYLLIEILVYLVAAALVIFLVWQAIEFLYECAIFVLMFIVFLYLRLFRPVPRNPIPDGRVR